MKKGLGGDHHDVKHKRRYCKIEGCIRIVKSQGLCQRHGATPRKCKVVDCQKQAQGGYMGMCKVHAKQADRISDCEHPDSSRLSRLGISRQDLPAIQEDSTQLAFQPPPTVPRNPPQPCATKTPAVPKRRYCSVEGCQRVVKSRRLCQRHGATPTKCKIAGCTKQAQGGHQGHCKAHSRLARRNKSLDETSSEATTVSDSASTMNDDSLSGNQSIQGSSSMTHHVWPPPPSVVPEVRHIVVPRLPKFTGTNYVPTSSTSSGDASVNDDGVSMDLEEGESEVDVPGENSWYDKNMPSPIPYCQEISMSVPEASPYASRRIHVYDFPQYRRQQKEHEEENNDCLKFWDDPLLRESANRNEELAADLFATDTTFPVDKNFAVCGQRQRRLHSLSEILPIDWAEADTDLSHALSAMFESV